MCILYSLTKGRVATRNRFAQKNERAEFVRVSRKKGFDQEHLTAQPSDLTVCQIPSQRKATQRQRRGPPDVARCALAARCAGAFCE